MCNHVYFVSLVSVLVSLSCLLVSSGGPRAETHSLGNKFAETSLDERNGNSKSTRNLDNYDQLKDEIFFDHRDSDCLSDARHQNACSSDWAFATIAIAEWHYCKMNGGKRVKFSEQYIMDCGRGRVSDRISCKLGGFHTTAVEFILNYGLQLRTKYRYSGRDGTCPYNNLIDWKSPEYKHRRLDDIIEIPVTRWAQAIEKEPLLVIFQADSEFEYYGGGVYDGSRCDNEWSAGTRRDLYYHSLVLVGHGRENGLEYWLMRNSFGQDWGEDGYFKLAKNAAKKCIWEQMAYGFGERIKSHLKIKVH